MPVYAYRPQYGVSHVANYGPIDLVGAYSISSKSAPIITCPEKMDTGADPLLDRP